MSALDRLPFDEPGWSLSAAVAVRSDVAGRWVHVSGQVPSGASLGGGTDGRRLDEQDEMRARAHAAFDAIASHLEKLGGSLSDVVRMTAYLTDLSNYKAFSEVRAARFADGLPASTAFQVAGIIGGETLEIDAVAFIADA